MASPTPRLATATRQAEIVAAALQLAQERSPALITTTDIAQSVGVTQGALFKHFENKEAIWLAAMEWVRENLLREIQTAAAASPEPLLALRKVFDAHVGFVAHHPGVPRMIFHELQQPADSPLKESVRGLMKSYRQLLLNLIKQSIQAGQSDPDLDAPAAATLFVGIMQGLVMQSMLSGHIATLRSEAPRVFDLYLRSLRTPL
ncbi:MAG: TetR family transcriptional regulator [Curvibacter sp. GWA2_64_110]|nr:MAG: TetR family transcriptional regulator [Curvibacter sp. GWA2_64_110]HCY15382.1 TetR family transcriptional regulator [Curvibacter sp.]